MFKLLKRIWSVGFSVLLVAVVIVLPFGGDLPLWVGKVISVANLLWWVFGLGGAVIHECWK